jgi:hypothetical protein
MTFSIYKDLLKFGHSEEEATARAKDFDQQISYLIEISQKLSQFSESANSLLHSEFLDEIALDIHSLLSGWTAPKLSSYAIMNSSCAADILYGAHEFDEAPRFSVSLDCQASIFDISYKVSGAVKELESASSYGQIVKCYLRAVSLLLLLYALSWDQRASQLDKALNNGNGV